MVARTSSAARTTRRLLGCGMVAGPLFVGAFLVEGALRPEYDPLRHPVSSLSLGPGGWTQRLNFLVTGGLYVAGAIGLWRARHQPGLATRAGPILLSTIGLGLMGAGVFASDPINGFPPGTPDAPVSTTVGRLHDLFSSPVFLCLPAAAIVYARAAARAGDRPWVLGSVGVAVAQFGTFVAAGFGFSQHPALINVGGAFQRASLIVGFGWLSGLCARAWRGSRDT